MDMTKHKQFTQRTCTVTSLALFEKNPLSKNENASVTRYPSVMRQTSVVIFGRIPAVMLGLANCPYTGTQYICVLYVRCNARPTSRCQKCFNYIPCLYIRLSKGPPHLHVEGGGVLS